MEIKEAVAKFQNASIAPMHTAEHILNQTMVRLFGCGRSKNAHIEKKKSKCDYDLCACIGTHVGNTAEIGKFKIISSDFENGRLRIRFKLEEPVK